MKFSYVRCLFGIAMVVALTGLVMAEVRYDKEIDFEGPAGPNGRTSVRLTLRHVVNSPMFLVTGEVTRGGRTMVLSGTYNSNSENLSLNGVEKGQPSTGEVARIDGVIRNRGSIVLLWFADDKEVIATLRPTSYRDLDPVSGEPVSLETPPDVQPAPRPTASLDLPRQITIFHTEQLLWPCVLRLVSRDGSIGHYAGQSVQGYPATADVQFLSDGSVTMQVACTTNGFSGTFSGKRSGNVVEGRYTAGAGFGGGYFKATLE